MNSHGTWAAALVALLSATLLPLAALAGPVNVNGADAATLARELQGIGISKAEAIVAHRDKHGPFRSVDDLARVKGIGRKTLDRNREFIRLDARAVPPRAAATPAPAQPAANGRRTAAPAVRPAGSR